MTAQPEKRIVEALLSMRRDDIGFWGWLEKGVDPSKKNANKFLLGCILDYQIRAETAWGNAKRLSEDILGDPDNLWEAITDCTLEEWNARRSLYKLHRYPKGHERVYTIGRRIEGYYGGDARGIWQMQSIGEVLYRLRDLGVGEQISRMVAGALVDTKLISGKSDVKADLHVRRVLGRLVYGTAIEQPQIAVELTRRMSPENPWLLDRPLYMLGKSVCKSSNPTCAECELQRECTYSSNRAS